MEKLIRRLVLLFDRLVQYAGRLLRLLVTLVRTRAKTDLPAARDWLRDHGRNWAHTRWDRLKVSLRPEEIQSTITALRTWAIEHDTVPEGVVARRREKRKQIDERHEAKEVSKHEKEETRTQKEDEQQEVYNMYMQ